VQRQKQTQQRVLPQERPTSTNLDPILAAKRAAMQSRGVPDTESFGVRMDALPEGLLDYIAFIDAPAGDEEEVEALAEALLTRWVGGGGGGGVGWRKGNSRRGAGSADQSSSGAWLLPGFQHHSLPRLCLVSSA